jgi:hypothetical protein
MITGYGRDHALEFVLDDLDLISIGTSMNVLETAFVTSSVVYATPPGHFVENDDSDILYNDFLYTCTTTISKEL